MKDNKVMVNEILDELEEGNISIMTDDKKRKLMIDTIRKYNQVLEEKIKGLEDQEEKKEDPKKEKEDPKKEAEKKSYKELAESKNIRR